MGVKVKLRNLNVKIGSSNFQNLVYTAWVDWATISQWNNHTSTCVKFIKGKISKWQEQISNTTAGMIVFWKW